jgi:uncharacterized protein
MAIFRSREAAEEFVQQDPFALEGLVKSMSLRTGTTRCWLDVRQ